jgi:hypothetical protein
VPLESLGLLCADAWRRKESGLNPSRIPIVTREYTHREEFSVDDPMRRGPYSGDHVDILGHNELLIDLMKIVTDQADEVTDDFVSDILDIANTINSSGGKKKPRFRIPLGKLRRRFRRFRSGLKKNKILSGLRKVQFPFQKKKKTLAQ